MLLERPQAPGAEQGNEFRLRVIRVSARSSQLYALRLDEKGEKNKYGEETESAIKLSRVDKE